MRARLFTMFVLITSFTLLLTLGPNGATPTAAQQPQPTPFPPILHEGGSEPYQTKDGLWAMPAGTSPRAPAQVKAPMATGGPDQFGYTWNDAVTFSWINATGGTDTGLNETRPVVGPISLPFSFKYYENTYSQVYISKFGYIGFTNVDMARSQDKLLSSATPNNIIAPYWTPTYLQSTGPTGRVYYTSGGNAPNRYFVVEWYNVKGGPPSDTIGDDETYHFEVILYENGDIVFQYQAMTYSGTYWCGTAGIEDSSGQDGLVYVSFCGPAPSNKAVRFYRPAPSARVSVNPQYTGRFTTAGATESFQFQVRNTGELGADTYNLSVASTWTTSLYAADGGTPISQIPSLAQGGTFTVTAKINVPSGAVIGNSNTATVTVQSSQDPTKQKTTTMQLAVPAPFAQVYRDNADGAMSLYLVQPNTQVLKKTTADRYYGYNMAVAEMPSGFAYFWFKHRSLGSVAVGEIEYTLLDRYGNTVRAVTKLTDHSGATMQTTDAYPAVAVAPNGRIGVLWYRYVWNSSNSQFNYNIYFAVLDAAGNVLYGPVNVTNNTVWGTSSALSVPRFFNPRIAAMGNNRFVLAWQKEQPESGGWVKDVYYAVRDSNGSEIKTPTKFTNDTAGADDGYDEPTLASISDNRAFLAFEREGNYSDIYFAVLDSDGNIVQGMTNLSNDGTTVSDWGWPDAIQLANGRIAVCWTMAIPNYRSIRYAVLDSSYNTIAGPTQLTHAAATTGNSYVSVTADDASRVVLTWMEFNPNRYLYYALVDGNGTILTPPMIFRTSQDIIETSFEGYGNTSYRFFPLFLPLILK